jgi:2-succinyl-5-enolpyruvyl-6-hydroxy-3-cyclohexene-1-carboxylate synthase
MTAQETLYDYLGAFVDELVRSGVRHVCISPGSRSTPLAMRFADHPDVKIWVHIDERSSAFFALGMAKTSRCPVALVCTSGSAAANYFPAVVEAFYGRVPLIVLTADRPHELRDVGAPQTIDQLRLYGGHVKWFVEMALPEATPEMLRYARTTAARAAFLAASNPAGPVHLNFPFREPLVPIPVKGTDTFARPAGKPYVRAVQGERCLAEATLKRLAEEVRQTARGLVICGPQDNPGLAEAVAELAEILDYPVLADPLSQVRCGSHNKGHVVSAYDAFLRHAGFAENTVPELVIRFGAMPVSKPLLMYLKRHASCRQMVVDVGERWNEPTLLADEKIDADPAVFCRQLTEKLHAIGRPSRSGGWFKLWEEANGRAETAMRAAMEGMDEGFFEGRVFVELAELMPDGAVLYVGNSMPVRDLDTFYPRGDKRVRFLGNRGVNGIDGIVSSSIGAGAASDEPVVLVIGDLSFYHDLNGLLAAKQHGLKITIVLLNNNGGGIFSFLPQAGHPRYFEQLFGTPIGLDFQKAVEMYGGRFTRAEDWEGFRAAVRDGLNGGGLSVVEVRTDRALNVKLHGKIWQAVSQALAE